MTQHLTKAAQRAGILTSTFKAWRIGENLQGYPVPLDDGLDLAAAVASVAQRCHHKQHFVVLETNGITGKQTAHFHEIRRESRSKWRRDPVTGEHKNIAKLYQVHLFSLVVTNFSPVEPFRWEPGCDVVGVDRNEVRA